MITELDEQQQERSEDRTTLVWSLLVSGGVNLMLWMVLAWTVALRTHAMAVAQDQPKETFTVTSSSLHIAQRTQPVPAQPHQSIDAQREPQQQRKPQQAAARQAVPEPRAQPTELARITPNGTPQPPSARRKQSQGTLAEELAQQQVAFQHETQQLNAQRAPLSIATIDPNERAAAQRSFQMDMPGMPGEPRRGEGIIYPHEMYRDHGYDCYEGGRYSLRYVDGQLEHGDIPWRFCYPPRIDPFLQQYRAFDMPLPLPGYRLPPGVQLQPAAKNWYEMWLSQQ